MSKSLQLFRSHPNPSNLGMNRETLSWAMGENLLKWALDKNLALLEDMIVNPDSYRVDEVLGGEQTAEVFITAVERGDLRNAKKSIDALEVKEWRRFLATPGGQIYASLLQRHKKNSRFRPTLDDGVKIASTLLYGHVKRSWLNEDLEMKFLPALFAISWLPPVGSGDSHTLLRYITLSEHSLVMWQTLEKLCPMITSSGQVLPQELLDWQTGSTFGRRQPPPEKTLSRGRPSRINYILRDTAIMVAIEMLARVGMRPYSEKLPSACAAVAQAMVELGVKPTDEDADLLSTVKSIRKKCIWKKSIEPTLRNYSNRTIERIVA